MKQKLFTLLFVVLIAPSFAFAQTPSGESGLKCNGGNCTYTALEPLPCPPNIPNCQSGEVSFPVFLSTIFKLLISIGGLFAVVMLVVAGIGYMLSESLIDIDKAKSRAKAALWGLLLLASSWLILSAVNPELLNFKLNPLSSSGTQAQKNTPANSSSNSRSNTLSTLTLDGDINSAENEQRWQAFAAQCASENGGAASQQGSTLTCSKK